VIQVCLKRGVPNTHVAEFGRVYSSLRPHTLVT
jgi:hypothetical protein